MVNTLRNQVLALPIKGTASWLAFLLLLLNAPLAVYAANIDRAAQIEQLYLQSGIQDAIAQFPSILKEGVASSAAESEHSTRYTQQVTEIIERTIDVDDLGSQVKQHLNSKLSSEHVDSILAWLMSPLGQKVVKLETTAATMAGFEEMSAQTVTLQKQYKGTPREKLFENFDRATRTTEAALETAMAVQLALVGAFADAGQGAGMPDYAMLTEMVEANRFMTRGLIGQQVFTNYLYTYRTLNDDELKRYIRFAESPAGLRYFSALNEALRSALIAPSKEIGRSILQEALGDISVPPAE
ncbi:multipass membrane protein [Oleiphilus messinensis]|uniref:Multipass membrane protein n=1 Tax=Oleiphilus messinensis TaxID=141451 RepID=A0A1Y0IE37_9GAMM|nr:hypothetical protein [Oleiphilus messinensis]ARU58772.1 multipass membrane protein [Oleiphilus messinensis]